MVAYTISRKNCPYLKCNSCSYIIFEKAKQGRQSYAFITNDEKIMRNLKQNTTLNFLR